jgi:hypothetical protein
MSTQARVDEDTSLDDRSPAEIELEIERTRERMSSNLDELGERLRPAYLGRRAKDAITDRVLDALTVALETIARNPLPVVAVTLAALSVIVRRRGRTRAAVSVGRG